LSLVSLCCVALCKYRPCDGLIAHPGSPNVRRNRLGNQKTKAKAHVSCRASDGITN
jgi:hypothetical protein